jgi:hypothetical protein
MNPSNLIRFAAVAAVFALVGCGPQLEGQENTETVSAAVNARPWEKEPASLPAAQSPAPVPTIFIEAPVFKDVEAVAKALEPVMKGQSCHVELKNYQYELRCDAPQSEQQLWDIAREASKIRGVDNVMIARD